MKSRVIWTVVVLCPLALALGCSQSSTDATQESAESGGQPSPAATAADSGHSLQGWWCSEHGVPEGECARCDSTLVAEFKARGDWCDDHLRPDSQCFICHPEKQVEFAARYEAKFGSAPPEPTE